MSAETTALPYRYYGNPADMVEIDESLVFQKRHGCAVCTHEGDNNERLCRLKRRKNQQGLCGGFDLDHIKVDQYGLTKCKGMVG